MSALRPIAIPALTAPFVLVTWMFMLPRQTFDEGRAGREFRRYLAGSGPGGAANLYADGAFSKGWTSICDTLCGLGEAANIQYNNVTTRIFHGGSPVSAERHH